MQAEMFVRSVTQADTRSAPTGCGFPQRLRLPEQRRGQAPALQCRCSVTLVVGRRGVEDAVPYVLWVSAGFAVVGATAGAEPLPYNVGVP